jgi:uncharacterized protein (UPF0548 family)
MITLFRPDDEEIARFRLRQQQSDYSYATPGFTRRTASPGYDRDHNRVALGAGEQAFGRATTALKQFEMFDLGWVHAFPASAEPSPGMDVAVLIQHFGFYSLNAARVVYVIDETGPPRRWGFAYGTLAEHAECGEERFLIEQDADGQVWYDLLAFSRPQQWFARIGYSVARTLQRRFVAESFRRMQAAVLR